MSGFQIVRMSNDADGNVQREVIGTAAIESLAMEIVRGLNSQEERMHVWHEYEPWEEGVASLHTEHIDWLGLAVSLIKDTQRALLKASAIGQRDQYSKLTMAAIAMAAELIEQTRGKLQPLREPKAGATRAALDAAERDTGDLAGTLEALDRWANEHE